MSPSQPDSALWEAFCQHDRHAFSELFQRYYSLLFQYGLKVTNNTQLIEDCIQELFIELWQQKKEKPVVSVKAYLVSSLKYKLFRALKRSTTAMLDKDPDEIDFELSYESLLIEREHDDEKVRKLSSAMQKLTPRQREIVYLKYYKGFSYEEVGHIMNMNYQVARNLLYQAIKTLKKAFLFIVYCLLFIVQGRIDFIG